MTAATLPVISNTLFKSFASFETTARFPDALEISSNENGTVPANFVRLSNAFAPSSADPNRNLNLMFRLSTSLPTSTNDFTTAPAPRPTKAPFKLKTLFLTFERFF